MTIGLQGGSSMSYEKQGGLTQEVLSGLAGISRSHLAEIETGRTKANVETLWRISEALGMKLSCIIGMVEEAIEKGERM